MGAVGGGVVGLAAVRLGAAPHGGTLAPRQPSHHPNTPSPGADSTRHNYLLLLLWALQFPLVWWVARGCRMPVAAGARGGGGT